jgi:phage tail sheath protein FI
MPEYLAPGVYVEEVSFRSKAIEGVATTTTGFVGPTRYGPLLDPPDIITSLAEYKRVYGDGDALAFGTNYMWHAANAFFAEGGRRLYVKRIFNGDLDTGRATGTLAGVPVSARYPGVAGRVRVEVSLQTGQNILTAQDPTQTVPTPVVRGLTDRDVVVVTTNTTTSPPTAVTASARLVPDPATGTQVWEFVPAASPPAPIPLSSLDPRPGGSTVQILTLSVSVTFDATDALPQVWPGLPLDPEHRLGGAPDSLAAVFASDLTGTDAPPLVFDLTGLPDGLAVLGGLGLSPAAPTVRTVLTGGDDGAEPTVADYTGELLEDDSRTGLVAFEDIDDISIVAAPGFSASFDSNPARAHAIVNALITHAQLMRYRIAVIDCGRDQTIAEVRAMRAQHDSSYAAFYYPWVTILDPITNQPADLPPSGFVAGIYARNDGLRAVYKAPANEVVNLAIGFERPISKAQQEVLNPEGINCFRFFEGRGYRLWGARLMSSDPEWKYVNLRRYFAFLERSIDLGTQWAVFEPNGERLWANVRSTISDFLLQQWTEGALLGDKPEKAFFVRCDRTTMTQNDIDNGRLVCLIGVAVIRPAEFVIFRIGQWTADAKK